MTRLNLLLLVALLGCSVFLVRVSYDARRLFTELDKAVTEERQLEVDFERLKAEKQSQATPSRVEAVARALYVEYLVPFEVASVLLLVAMVGAIVLARRDA